MQKAAEAKLAAACSGASASPDSDGSAAQQQAGSGGSRGRKADGKLLFDLVYEGDADLCIKVRALLAVHAVSVAGWPLAAAGMTFSSPAGTTSAPAERKHTEVAASVWSGA